MRDHPGLSHLALNERDALDALLAWLQYFRQEPRPDRS
jgi:hypothetical protein